MKASKGQLIAFVLLLLIAAAAVGTVLQAAHYRSAFAEHEQLSQAIDTYSRTVQQKQVELESLAPTEAESLKQEAKRLSDEAAVCGAEADAADANAAELETTIAEMQEEYEKVKENAEYYQTVRAALEEGYQEVLRCLGED